MPLSKREATTIITALSAGVTPRTGLRHIAVGRLNEVTALKKDLAQIEAGGASVRFVIGRYGSGKSFLLQLLRSNALESRFVVADADFSPERRLFGSGNEALATYRELVRNLSTLTRPDGNALPSIIDKWLSGIQSRVVAELQIQPDSTEFSRAVNQMIFKTLNNMEEMVQGFDFSQVINAYYQGHINGDDVKKSNAIRWLRGEFTSKTEAYSALKVRSIIDSDNYYEYIKVLARFVRDVGYSGLLICFDEAAYLYKITNSVSRKNNYEAILTIFNDCLQGKASSLGFIFGGTPEFLNDPRRGLFSYEALQSRLSGNRFATPDLQDFSGPVLSLPTLSNEEVFVLLQKVRLIYDVISPMQQRVSDLAIQNLMEGTLQRIGAKEFTTPRELIRDFVNVLNLLAQYPDKSWEELMGNLLPANPQSDPTALTEKDRPEVDPLDRFIEFKVN